MDRRQEIERIIIGTILNSFEDKSYLMSCRSCITSEMFKDERHRVIYENAVKMSSLGMKTITPADMIEYDPELITMAAYLCELATDCHFDMKKYEYNRVIWYTATNNRPRYTNVTFDDYVTRFIQLVFNDEQQEGSPGNWRSREAAA